MSLADVQTALRAGFFSLLQSDGVLQNLLGSDRVFEAPPRAEAFPYLVLETMETRPLLAEIGDGAVHALGLSVFSRGRSRDEAAEAAGRAVEVLMSGPVRSAPRVRLCGAVAPGGRAGRGRGCARVGGSALPGGLDRGGTGVAAAKGGSASPAYSLACRNAAGCG